MNEIFKIPVFYLKFDTTAAVVWRPGDIAEFQFKFDNIRLGWYNLLSYM